MFVGKVDTHLLRDDSVFFECGNLLFSTVLKKRQLFVDEVA